MAARRMVPADLSGLAAQFFGKLAARALEGAADALLEEVQGVTREADERVTKARKKIAKKRKPTKVIDVEAHVVDDDRDGRRH